MGYHDIGRIVYEFHGLAGMSTLLLQLCSLN